jgi:hypothetical protein
VDSDGPAYRVRSENGQAQDDASEDIIYEMLTELSEPDNTYLIVERPSAESPWRAVASLLPGGGFEVEYRDSLRGEHRVVTETNPDRVALDLIVWVSAVVRGGR